MILKIVLFFSYMILVSSNNGSPIIQAQTYPIYQQNVYTNPPQNQFNDITPYLQSVTVQNQAPSLNLSPYDIKQILLNRILSSAPIQTILDQNVGGYGSNLAEYNNNPIAFNPVSNYYATPTVFDYLNNQSTDVNRDDAEEHNKTEEKRRKSKRRKSSKSRRKHNESEKNHKSSRKKERTNDEDNDKEVSKKSRKRSRKHKTDVVSQDNETKNDDDQDNRKSKPRKRKNKESHRTKDRIDDDIEVENPKPRRRRKKKTKSDNDDIEQVIPEQPTIQKPLDIHDILDFAHFNEGIIEEYRVPRNPLNEGNDFMKSIPNVPENIVKSFNFKNMPQFNNNPAMSDFFAKYENMFQSMMSNNKHEQKEIKRRKPSRSRKPQRRKIAGKNRNSTATEATIKAKLNTPVVKPKVNIVTTEKTIFINEKTRTNIDPVPTDEGLKSSNKPSEIEEIFVKVLDDEGVGDTYNEPQDQDLIINEPDYSKGYIEDYYPLFTDSAAYNANKREVYIKNLGDTKYYYAVDKENPEFINRMRFESFSLPERVLKDYEVNKQYDEIEKESTRNSLKAKFNDTKEETIQFRSPPHLETPDFETRKIERSEIIPEPYYYLNENDDFNLRLGDKSSSYSDAKTPYYSGDKQNGIKTLKDKDVETVFAKSKVVRYSPVYYPEESSVGITNQALDDSFFKEGGTTYVLATSLDYPEPFW